LIIQARPSASDGGNNDGKRREMNIIHFGVNRIVVETS
jgi:hypothetical protein